MTELARWVGRQPKEWRGEPPSYGTVVVREGKPYKLYETWGNVSSKLLFIAADPAVLSFIISLGIKSELLFHKLPHLVSEVRRWKLYQGLCYKRCRTVKTQALVNNKALITGPLVSSIGKAHNKTGAQVALRWVVQQGSAPPDAP